MRISHTGCGLSIADVAKACGFVRGETVATLAGVSEIDISASWQLEGPELYVIKVKAENLPRNLPPRDAVHVKNRFRASFGLSTA